MLPEVECAQQDVEAHKIGEDEPNGHGQEQVVGVDGPAESLSAAVFGSGLVGGHAAEHRVHPACHLARFLLMLAYLATEPLARRGVVAVKNLALDVGREEVCERDERKQHHGKHVGQEFFPSFHYFPYF